MIRIRTKSFLVVSLLVIVLFFSGFGVYGFDGYTLTVDTDQGSYYPGENVKVSGYLKYNGVGVSGGAVCVDIVDPSGMNIFSICITTDSNGYYHTSKVLSSNAELGVYSVHAEAHVDTGDISAYTTFKVVSTSVEADADGPYYGIVNHDVRFYGDAFGGKTPYSWYWSFGDGTSQSRQNPTHVYTMNGTYTVKLTVEDRGGYGDVDTTTAFIANELTVEADGPYTGFLGSPVSFYGSAGGGFPPYTWLWDFGDGNTSIEQNPTHVYSYLGDYTVVLTVTDDKGNQGSDTAAVSIFEENYPPADPVIDGPTSGKPGVTYEYNIYSSDPDGDDIGYIVDFGDGIVVDFDPIPSGDLLTVEHSWSNRGNYEMKVKAVDINGLESNWSTLPISIPKGKIIMFFDLLSKFLELFKIIFGI